MLPLCARCTGVYMGFLIAFIFLWLISLQKRFLHFSKKASLGSTILFAAFLIESLLSSRGLLNTGNHARFLSGMSGGIALGVFSFGLLNYSLRGKTYFAKAAFSSVNLLVLILIALSVLFLKRFLQISFYFWYLLTITGLVFTYIMVNITLVSFFLTGKTRKSKKFWWKLGFYTTALLAVEIFIIGFFR